ncbi:6885_t:CDS:2, partial [Funneliformis mosseae]
MYFALTTFITLARILLIKDALDNAQECEEDLVVIVSSLKIGWVTSFIGRSTLTGTSTLSRKCGTFAAVTKESSGSHIQSVPAKAAFAREKETEEKA